MEKEGGASRFETRLVGGYDRATGETLDAVPVLFARRQRWEEESFIVFLKAAEALAIDRDLGAEALRVGLYLIGHAGYENWVHVRQTVVAEALGMKQPSVARALKRLVDRGVLVQGAKMGRSYTYRLNSKIGWRGRVESLKKHRESEDGRKEPHLRLVKGGADAALEDGRQGNLLPPASPPGEKTWAQQARQRAPRSPK